MLGGLAQDLARPTSQVPAIGASGAIAGVLGAYLVLFPRAHILIFIPTFFLPWLVELPAPIYLGVWFVSQFFSGVSALGMAAMGGIAYWAHVGGFARRPQTADARRYDNEDGYLGW